MSHDVTFNEDVFPFEDKITETTSSPTRVQVTYFDDDEESMDLINEENPHTNQMTSKQYLSGMVDGLTTHTDTALSDPSIPKPSDETSEASDQSPKNLTSEKQNQ